MKIRYMENSLFLGLSPYKSDELEYLPVRKDDVRKLAFMLDSNSVNILCSDPKVGKTSIINSAFAPSALQAREATALIFNVPQFHFGDLVLEKQLVEAINAMCQKPTYLDLCFEDDHSLWYASKKLQACYPASKKFYLIFDQFDNIFTYGSAARREFATALAQIIYGDVPNSFATEIQKIMMGESDTVVPKDAMPLLLDSPRVSVLFSVSQDLYSSLAQFNDQIRGIFQNTMFLSPFDVDSAKEAVQAISAQPLPDIPVAAFDTAATDRLVSHFASSGGTVNPGLLRNAVLFLRKYAAGSGSGSISVSDIDNSGFLQMSYVDEAMALLSGDESRAAIMAFVNGEMALAGETQPLPAYRGVAVCKYGVSDTDLELLASHYVLRSRISDDGRIYYLPFSADVFRRLRTADESTIGPGEKNTPLPQAAPMPMPAPRAAAFVQADARAQKSRITKPVLYASAMVVLISLAFVFVAFSMKDDAERNASQAKSSMLSAIAFQKLDTDPTLSLRLSQKSVFHDTSNVQAYSAMLTSFYNTDIFYNIAGIIEDNKTMAKAEVSMSGNYLMTYIKNDQAEKYSARILRENGDVVVDIPHKMEITSISMSAGENKIITTSYDSVARVFGMDGRLLMEIANHRALLWKASISPDGRYIATAGSDGNVMVWDSLGNAVSTLSGHDFDVYCVGFSPDGQSVLSSSGDNTARLWSVDGKRCKVMSIKDDNRFCMSLISQAVFSPDGKYILLAANDYLNKNHKARLWDLDGNELTSFAGHDKWINSVGFSHDGKHVITSSRDNMVRVFGLEGRLEKLLKGHNSNVWSAAYKSDDKSIVTVGDDHTIRTWGISKRFESYESAVNVGFAVFSPDGLRIMVVQDTLAQAWNLVGEVMANFAGHNAPVTTARMSYTGTMVATASKDSTARIWDRDGNLLHEIRHDGIVYDAIFSPDDQYLVSVSGDSSIIIHNIATRQDIISKGSHQGGVTSVAFSPNAPVFVTGGMDGKVILHDISGKAVRIFQGHDGRVNSVCFSPNGQSIISTSSDETAVLWDNLGQMKFTFRGYENKVNSAVFSPDGKYIATTSDDGSARLWTPDGKDIMNFHHDGRVSDAVFSPDGKYLLTVFHSSTGLKTIKLRMLSPDDINRHIDQLDLYGKVWQPDSETLKKYGVGE